MNLGPIHQRIGFYSHTQNPIYLHQQTPGPIPTKEPRVPHISLVFREMWETTDVILMFFADRQ
jgi:hypothetical protein